MIECTLPWIKQNHEHSALSLGLWGNVMIMKLNGGYYEAVIKIWHDYTPKSSRRAPAAAQC